MYIVEEHKQITITDSKNKKHFFIVSLDFKATEKNIENLMNSDKDLLRCEEWLKNKGFIKEEKGWSIYSDKKRSIIIPSFFIDFQNKNLRIKFHKIIGLYKFVIPVIKHGNRGAKYYSYSTLNNLPDYTDCVYDFPSILLMSNEEYNFYRKIVKTDFFLYNSDFTIDNKFFLDLINIGNVELLKKYDYSQLDIQFFKDKYPDVYQQIKSYLAINKFNL